MNKTYFKGYIQKSQDEDIYEFIASTASVDRQGDSIDQSGWELDNYLKNPVILFAHNYSELPIAKAIDVIKADSALIIKIQFASEEANPKAQQIKRLVDEGILNTTSVGFIQKERNGNIITRAELLEVSIVPVPANQDALRLAYKSLDDDIVKEIETAISKGEIQSELNAEEIFEKKWENFKKVSDVISAFWSVYFDENTPLEKFNDLVGETIDILGKIKNGEVVNNQTSGDITKSISEETYNKYVEGFAVKEGRVISQKNKKAIEDALNALKTAHSELEKLLNLEVATTEEDVEGKSNLVLVDRSLIEDLKFMLRSDNRTNDKILSTLKNI